MRRMFAAIARYRPRVLTLLVLLAVAGLITLSNLSYEIREVTDFGPQAAEMFWTMPYGWPLLWRRYVIITGPGPSSGAVVWHYSSPRLIGNLAMWILMLAAPAGACEWLLRRYRPRMRWSLRSMLVAVALAAALCDWITAARNRANLQDSLIETIDWRGNGHVWFERWGPKWLDLVGADRFRRHIFAVELGTSGRGGNYEVDEDEELEDIELFKRIGRLSDLRYLCVEDDRLTIDAKDALADALGNLTHLRWLQLGDWSCATDSNEERFGRKCLVAIGAMTQLEDLRLEGIIIADDSIAKLAALTNLKTLYLDAYAGVKEPESYPPLLRRFPVLPRLDALDVASTHVRDGDLSYLAALPRLKSLGLGFFDGTDAGLARLAPLTSLEELEIDGDLLSAIGLRSLLALKQLKTLHIRQGRYDESRLGPPATLALDNGAEIAVPKRKLDGCIRGLEILRESRPGIVIDRQGLGGFDDPAESWRHDKRLSAYHLSELWENGNMVWYPTKASPEFAERLKALKW